MNCWKSANTSNTYWDNRAHLTAMNEQLLQTLGGKEYLYPKNLEEQFPRVLNRILELWNKKEIDMYFKELMFDNRGSNRRGFPHEVASEIFTLSLVHARLFGQTPQPVTGTNFWIEADKEKRAAIELLGYAFSPQGFIKAAEKGEQNVVASFLNSGVDIDTRDAHGWTPLMVSAFNGRDEVAGYLIRNGADIHARDMAGYGSLHWAAFNGYYNIVKLLIVKGANVNERSHHGWTPLLQAATRGHLLVAGQLIAGGANIDYASNDGWSPLHKAAANGHTEVVKLLIAKGVNSKTEYQDGTTPIALAIKNKHEDIVALLSAAHNAP